MAEQSGFFPLVTTGIYLVTLVFGLRHGSKSKGRPELEFSAALRKKAWGITALGILVPGAVYMLELIDPDTLVGAATHVAVCCFIFAIAAMFARQLPSRKKNGAKK